MPLLYDAVALSMGAYTRSAFRVQTLGGADLRLEPGTIIVSTHRRETDVPLLCPALYRYGRLWWNRRGRVSFAARADLFEPGFAAGFPASLPTRVRKALYGISFADTLRGLGVNPIRSASQVRLEDICRQAPRTELDELLPPEVVSPLRARAAELGLVSPVLGADVLRGEYADLLWRSYTREELDGAPIEPLWGRQAALAATEFRYLVSLVKRGAVLVVFPEGRPSPDGEIGPLRPGLGALIRRSQPAWLQPVGLAYDALTAGRTRAYISFGPRVEPPTDGVDEAVLALLRRTMPLTCGQIAAARLLAGEPSLEALERELEQAVDAARSERRAFDPELADAPGRRRRLSSALAAARTRRAVLPYLAREYESANTGSP